jgi:hypothetical protein
MPTARHPEYTSGPADGPEEGTKQFIPAVPELKVGEADKETLEAPAETAVSPTPGETIAPENLESAVAPTSAEQPTTPLPAPEPESAPSTPAIQDQVVQPAPAATIAEQHSALDEPITAAAPVKGATSPAEQLAASYVDQSEYTIPEHEEPKSALGRALGWVIDRVSAKPKPGVPENQVVIPGERPNAPVMPIAESNPGRRAELERLAEIAEKNGQPGVISRENQDVLDRGILTENNQQDPEDQKSVQKEAA